jgi:hypothetical protein
MLQTEQHALSVPSLYLEWLCQHGVLQLACLSLCPHSPLISDLCCVRSGLASLALSILSITAPALL